MDIKDLLIDFSEIKDLLNRLYDVTKTAMAIGDLDGNFLVKTDFHDICERFHRANEQSCANCVSSDKKLFDETSKGKYFCYKCLNGLWDISIPIMIEDDIVGVIIAGQFLYDDEEVDEQAFREQAKKYNFDESAYMAALNKVPRVSHEYIKSVTDFYTELTKMIALISYKNLDIKKAHDEYKRLFGALKRMENRLRLIINHFPDGIVIYNSDYKVTYVNDPACIMLEQTKENVVGAAVETLWAQKKEHIDAIKNAFENGVTQSIDCESECLDKMYKNLLFTYIPMMDDNQVEILSVIHDYSKRKKAEDEKAYQDVLINEMGRAAKIGGWEFDPRTGKGTWTDEVARIHDMEVDDETSMSEGLSFYADESKALIEEAIKKASEEGVPYNLELELITKKGDRKWVRTIGEPTIINGVTTRLHGSFQDITVSKQNEERIKESELRYRVLLDEAPIGIVVHVDGKIVFANPASLKMFGEEKAEDVIGTSIFDVIHPSGIAKVEERIKKWKAGEKDLYPAEDLYVRKDGSTFPVEVVIAPIKYNGISAVQAIITDITERKKTESRLIYLSYHDQLTGIYNRRYFEESLEKIDNIENLPLSIIMADVNGLKLINDSFGYTQGDQLLIKVAEIIQNSSSENDLFARFGGDEFILMMPQTSNNLARDKMKKIQEVLKNESINSVELSVSYGIKTKEKADEQIEDILADVENEMYRRKIYESTSMHSKSVEIILNALYEKSRRELMHSKRVSKYCEEIAKALKMDKDFIDQIKTAGLVHDIGKIGIDEMILNKPTKLNSAEWVEMKKHPEKGWRILVTSSEFSKLADFVLEHHERWDGKGYPKGLRGEAISLEARIIALADAYDAMTSHRSYRMGMNKEEARKEIERNSGKQFDKAIVDVFLNHVLSET